jgi:hypothetical protein
MPRWQLGRIHPHVAVLRHSPNRSSRNGVRPRLIVLHSTEGHNQPGSTADLAGLAAFFANPAAQVSSHVATDSDGKSAVFVRAQDKAWHCAGYNSLALGIEQIGFAAQFTWASAELKESARWVAKWSKDWGIPITRGAVSGGGVARAGVVTHKDLGVIGGGHVDPGSGYDVDRVLHLARRYRRHL